tara:strand:+ start:278 stop:829 length:552 start_codon:yes stop_codon:yes gene_type:complete
VDNILGLDISTSCIGWCVLGPKGQLVAMGYIPLSKHIGLFKKAQEASEHLSIIAAPYNITKTYIEENLQAFRPGLSSAKTLLTLARFNGIVGYLVQQQFDFEPEYINVNAARKLVGLKIVRKSKGGAPTKEQVHTWVSERVAFNWPTKTLKSGPRKNQTILEPGCYDAADAYVIAQAGYLTKD